MIKEIRLDYLQNPPLDKELSNLLIPDFNFNSIALKEQELDFYRNNLKDRFDKNFALPFNFSVGGFLELFTNFKKIYFTESLHYETRKAIELISKFIETESIPLENLESNLIKIDSQAEKSSLIIIPSINEDIFSINKIPEIKNAILALDISYSTRLGIKTNNKANIVIINGVTFGLPNGFGLIASDRIYTSALYKKGVSKVFNEVLDKQIITDSSNVELFNKLKKTLGNDIDLFTQDFAPNTLPLRFKHINTRNLIQHLYLDDIHLQSSQDCYLGFIRPSHTLVSLGFGQLTSRELCAISFDKIDDIDFIADKLIQGYKIIRLMEF